MTHDLMDFETNTAVAEQLERVAREVSQTQAQQLEQRVSLVFSAMGERSGVTREQVRKAVLKQAVGGG